MTESKKDVGELFTRSSESAQAYRQAHRASKDDSVAPPGQHLDSENASGVAHRRIAQGVSLRVMNPRFSAFRSLSRTLIEIYGHPMGGLKGISRFLRWQGAVRMLPAAQFEVPWVDGTSLILQRGMHGATGNYYCGLLEFREMSFLLDFLKPNDLFVDVGANVGVYTVLASGARSARTIALEPGELAFGRLRRNVEANSINHLVECRQMGASSREEQVRFIVDADTTNRVYSEKIGRHARLGSASMDALDSILAGQVPVLIKIDVEGWELPVLEGASATLSDEGLQALIVETNSQALTYGYAREDIFTLLQDFNFRAVTYEPSTRRILSSVTENRENVLFVRNVKRVEQRLGV